MAGPFCPWSCQIHKSDVTTYAACISNERKYLGVLGAARVLAVRPGYELLGVYPGCMRMVAHRLLAAVGFERGVPGFLA